jgi:hypothetical protein
VQRSLDCESGFTTIEALSELWCIQGLVIGTLSIRVPSATHRGTAAGVWNLATEFVEAALPHFGSCELH